MSSKSLRSCVLLFIPFYMGCIRETDTRYVATLYNPSSHFIEILPFKNGIVNPTDTIRLLPAGNFLIADKSSRGESGAPGFSSEYFGGPNDSVIVRYDGVYTMVHYFNPPDIRSAKYYLPGSLRNIANPLSYDFVRTGSKKKYTNDHKYYFTEQDYLDAKD